jgi:hypothetical protein
VSSLAITVLNPKSVSPASQVRCDLETESGDTYTSYRLDLLMRKNTLVKRATTAQTSLKSCGYSTYEVIINFMSAFVVDSSASHIYLKPSSISIFDDVEESKVRLLELRRAAVLRRNNGESLERANSMSADRSIDEKNTSQFSTTYRSIIQAESELAKCEAVDTALQDRRNKILVAMKTLRKQLVDARRVISQNNSAKTPDSSEETSPLVNVDYRPVKAVAKKRSRYFEKSGRVEEGKSVPASEPARKRRETEQTGDDPSTILCSFDLRGTCTDPQCPFMHLNR